jgi:hypothetical protein
LKRFFADEIIPVVSVAVKRDIPKDKASIEFGKQLGSARLLFETAAMSIGRV